MNSDIILSGYNLVSKLAVSFSFKNAIITNIVTVFISILLLPCISQISNPKL